MSFSLRDAIDRPIRCFEIASPKGVTVIKEARKAVQKTLEQSTPQRPAQRDLEATCKRLLMVVDGSITIEDLKLKEVREGAWLVFQYLEDRQLCLSETEPFFSDYLRRASQQKTPRTMISIILSFLENYPVSSPRFQRQCLTLLQAIGRANLSDRLRKIVDAIKKYKLLDLAGPSTIANELLLGDSNWRITLENAFLTDIRANVGIVEKVFEQCSVLIKASLTANRSDQGSLSRYLEFAVNDQGSDLRFSDQRVQLVSTLLLPFETKNPTGDVQELLKRFLLQHFGDPRTEPARWMGVPDNVRAVLRRWLVADTFEDFFRIVDLSQQLDPDADRQWRYRRAFWQAYFNKGVIEDAWLILGSQVQWQAKRMLDIDPKNYGEFGRGSGAKKTHASLVLKINDYVFTEWSHMGMWRMWHETDSNAPKLYKPQYSRYDLVKMAMEEGSHFSTARGGWQLVLAQTIRARTGINVTRRQFMAGV